MGYAVIYKKKTNKQREPIMTNTITIPSNLQGFIQTNSDDFSSSNANECVIEGYIENKDKLCPRCGCKMHNHDWQTISLKHLFIGLRSTSILVSFCRYEFPACKTTLTDDIPFKAQNHFITKDLLVCVEDLLASDCV